MSLGLSDGMAHLWMRNFELFDWDHHVRLPKGSPWTPAMLWNILKHNWHSHNWQNTDINTSLSHHLGITSHSSCASCCSYPANCGANWSMVRFRSRGLTTQPGRETRCPDPTNPPAPKVLGRDLPDGTRKRLQVYLGGGGAFFGQNLLFLIDRDARLQKTL